MTDFPRLMPNRVEVYTNGEWVFAGYAYDSLSLAEMLFMTYQDSKTRVFEDGVLTIGKDGDHLIDYRIN